MPITEDKFNGGSIEETITDAQIFINFDLGRVKVLEPHTADVEVFLPNAQLTPWIEGGIVYEIINTGSKTLFLNKWDGGSTGIAIGPNQVGSISLGHTSEEFGDFWRCQCRDILSSTTTPVTTTTTTTTTSSSTCSLSFSAATFTGPGFTGTWGDPDSNAGLSSEDPRIDPNYTHLPIFHTEATPFGRLAPPLPARKMPAATSVSVVITTINEGPDLEMTIRSLLPLLRETDEIIVVDDGSVLRMDRRVLGFRGVGPTVKFCRHEIRKGCAQARATGARASSGDLLIFVDSHMIFPENWLDEMLNAHALYPNSILCPISADIDDEEAILKADGHWGTNADLYNHPDKGLTAIWAPLDAREALEPLRTPSIMGACYAVSRGVLRDLGGWALGLRGWGFDEEFLTVRAWMLGYEVRLVPSTYAAHRYTRPASTRADAKTQSEEPWVIVYARAYMNFVLFGAAKWLGSDEEIDRSLAEAKANSHEWHRDRAYILSKRTIDDAGFWQLMNEVRGEANIQLPGGACANAN